MKFEPFDFGWDFSKYGSLTEQELKNFNYIDGFNIKESRGVAKIKTQCDILNSLTEEQQKAVRFYGQCRYDEGYGQGFQEKELG